MTLTILSPAEVHHLAPVKQAMRQYVADNPTVDLGTVLEKATKAGIGWPILAAKHGSNILDGVRQFPVFDLYYDFLEPRSSR